MVISVFWIADSVEHCHVEFLPCFLVPLADNLNGILAQVMEVFNESHSSAIVRKKVHQNYGYCSVTILANSMII